MYRLSRSVPLWAACVAAIAPFATIHAQQTFTPKTIVQWGQGGERERAMLTQMGLGQLAQGQFGLATADLNADGRPEIIVLGISACDSTGCPVVALKSDGPGKVQPIFAQKVAARLAITNEALNGYNAFAAADQAGAIMKNAAGQLIVYPVGATGQAAATPPAAQPPAAPAARPPTVARAPAPAAAAPAAPAAVSAAATAVANARALFTGEGQPPWHDANAVYIPVCLFPRCLNMQIVEKTGIGTDKAMIRGAVTPEDAARWCAIYMPRDRLCPENEVANFGTAGGATGRPKASTIEANCTAGTMRAIDNSPYTYNGTWPDGGPGAGRAKFSGLYGGGVGTRIFEQQGQTSASQSIYLLAREPNSGEALAIQWELLCPGVTPAVQ